MAPTAKPARPTAIILGCVSGKALGPAKAKDLYDSPLFDRRRRYAEASGLPWVIYSAEHGILDPDEVIGWYDVALKNLPGSLRRRKGEAAARQLESRFGPLRDKVFEIHAGAAYVSSLATPLAQRGARLVNPLDGLKLGYQLQWYGKGLDGAEPASRSLVRHRERTRQASATAAFRLQFDPARIADLARGYDYGGDDRVAEIGAAARARGWFTRSELLEICHWKSPRSGPLVAMNTSIEVETATRRALRGSDDDGRIGPLLALKGVSWPTASVLLHFAHRDRYPILDVRALEALGVSRTHYSLRFWTSYVDATRRLADQYQTDMRTFDRALWQWSKLRAASTAAGADPIERQMPRDGGSKSDRMRQLFAKGLPVAEVATRLDVTYAFAYGVRKRWLKKGGVVRP
jgi:hypothetical protein